MLAHRVHIGLHRVHRGHVHLKTAVSASVGSSSVHENLMQRLEAVSNRHEQLTFPITGVTFDNRQEHLSRIAEGVVWHWDISFIIATDRSSGHPVQLTWEPDNEFDRGAVTVNTLTGTSLGYIPRDLTNRIAYPVTMSWVRSIGRGQDSGNLGAFVRWY